MDNNTPYPLIIIDDEPLARQAFSRLLSDRFPKFRLTGEADSGPEGLKLFRKLRPPIVIMDIRIPGIDGLECSRIILKESPGTHIIVLSAYDDFHYVQEALHDGVLGYLLKPVKEDDLNILLQKAVHRITANAENQRTRELVRTYKSIAVREQVASFIYGSKAGIAAEDFALLSDPPIEQGYFLVFRCIGDFPLDAEQIRRVNDRLDRMDGCSPGEWMGNYLPLFVRSEKGNADSWHSEAEFLSREICHLIQSITGGRVFAGVGPLRQNPQVFGDSFRKAFDALQDNADSRKIVFTLDRTEKSSGADNYPVAQEEIFLQACRASDGGAALKAAEELVDHLVSPDLSLMDARFSVTEFLIVFRREWERISGEPKRRSMANLLREALLCSDHEVLKQWFLLVVRDLVRNLDDTDDGEALLMRKVRHFIDLNNLSEVSLESAAESVGLTAPYLSRVFKEQTGMYFHDYVVDRRLDAALRLIKETSLPIGEVARRVGYGDVGYFSRIFRKKYGSPPREYRNSVV